MMIFLANDSNVVQKSHLLRALNNKVFPDLRAFLELGFPLKQTLKVFPRHKQKEAKKTFGQEPITNDPNILFDFKGLPAMQRALGHHQSSELIKDILRDLDSENPDDFGCICEIDVSNQDKILKILQKIFDQYLNEMQKNEEAKKDEELKQQELDKKAS